jgi:hypothetical protein
MTSATWPVHYGGFLFEGGAFSVRYLKSMEDVGPKKETDSLTRSVAVMYHKGPILVSGSSHFFLFKVV